MIFSFHEHDERVDIIVRFCFDRLRRDCGGVPSKWGGGSKRVRVNRQALSDVSSNQRG